MLNDLCFHNINKTVLAIIWIILIGFNYLVMEGNHKQWWSIILQLSTKRPKPSHVKQLITHKKHDIWRCISRFWLGVYDAAIILFQWETFIYDIWLLMFASSISIHDVYAFDTYAMTFICEFGKCNIWPYVINERFSLE
jgi:hypothetical protein